MEKAIASEHLSACYDEQPVLWDISVAIPKGSLAAVIGPNGAGKSTFLKACIGLVKPFSGKVLCLEKEISSVRNKIAYVPQKETVDWEFPITVFEVVLMGRCTQLGLFKQYRKADKQAALEILQLLEIEHLKDKQISELSGGQQQRVFIARALMQDAELFLLDEPFTGIDATTESTLMQLFKTLQAKGKTIVIVHHDLQTVKEVFDWTVLINTRLVASGKTSEVFNEENLSITFGKKGEILTEVVGLISKKQTGL